MRNHTGDPELGLFSWHLWSHLVGAPIIHGPMRCGKSPIVPHFYTSSGSRATDTPDFPIWQAFYSFKQGGIFPNFKISVCPLLHFSGHWRLTVCSEMAWWKTWKTHRVQWDGMVKDVEGSPCTADAERRGQLWTTVGTIHPRCVLQWGGDIPQDLETQQACLWWTYPVIRNLSRNDIPMQMEGKKQSIWE